MSSFPKPAEKIATHKVCKECLSNRDIKFFSSKRALSCNDCKKSAAYKKRINRPANQNKKADDAWSKAVKERDGHKCAYCGKTEYLNSHHIFSRKHMGLRWDLDNGITLCSGHHNFSTTFSAHKTPVEFIEWLKERNGEEWYQKLRSKAKQLPTFLYK